jgi:hypothetical protein
MKLKYLIPALMFWLSGNLLGQEVIMDTVTTQRVITVKFKAAEPFPQQIKISVNPGSSGKEPWIPFSTNVQVDLGPSDGLKTVSISFKSSFTDGSSHGTSSDYKVYVNPAPNVFSITNPVQTFVTQPMIEIQGYTPWNIIDLKYAVLDQNGVTTSTGDGIVNNRYFEKALWDFTTNYFTLYDIQLNPGTNTIQLQASDRDGKLIKTNLVYVFSTQSVNSGPRLTLDYPHNGDCTSGGPISIQGYSDDFTIKIVGIILTPRGEVIRQYGEVERNGRYWIDNVPLLEGRTYVTLIANNAAGYTTITNFSFRKSRYDLTIKSPPADELWRLKVTLTGTSSYDRSNYTIVANGVKATVDASGNWKAENVPVPEGGVAIFNVKAIAKDGHDQSDEPDILPAVPIAWNASTNEIQSGIYLIPGDTNHFNQYQCEFYLVNHTGTNMDFLWMRPARESVYTLELCDKGGNKLSNSFRMMPDEEPLSTTMNIHHLYANDLDRVDGVLELITNVPVHLASFSVINPFSKIPPGDYQIKAAARLYKITDASKLMPVELPPVMMPVTIKNQPSETDFYLRDLETAGKFLWGQPTNSIKAGVAHNFEPHQFNAKNEIEIFLVNNGTNNTGHFELPQMEEQFDLSLRDSSGQEVPKTTVGTKQGKSLSSDNQSPKGLPEQRAMLNSYRFRWLSLPANEAVKCGRFDLNTYFNISEPGKYSVTYQQRLFQVETNRIRNGLILPPVTVPIDVQ